MVTTKKKRRLHIPASSTLLIIASVAALIALAMVVWSLLQPTVVPVMVSMSIGQGVGLLSFALYLVVVLRDVLSRSAPERMQHSAMEALRRRPTGEMQAAKPPPDMDVEEDEAPAEPDAAPETEAADDDAADDAPKGEGG